jgi:hypothetical protein
MVTPTPWETDERRVEVSGGKGEGARAEGRASMGAGRPKGSCLGERESGEPGGYRSTHSRDAGEKGSNREGVV